LGIYRLFFDSIFKIYLLKATAFFVVALGILMTILIPASNLILMIIISIVYPIIPVSRSFVKFILVNSSPYIAKNEPRITHQNAKQSILNNPTNHSAF